MVMTDPLLVGPAAPGAFPGLVGPSASKVTRFDADRKNTDMSDGIDAHWLVHPEPHMSSTAQEELIRSLDWPPGRVQTCIAGESGVIKSLRSFLANEKQVPREDTYISEYWKNGLVEDEHQLANRTQMT